MEFTEKEIKQSLSVVLFISLVVLIFFLLKPVLMAVVGGLILAYIMFPVHKQILRLVKEKHVAAALTTLIVLCITLVPLWFLLPTMINQSFNFFKLIQNLDITPLLNSLLPTASETVKAQIITTYSTFTSKTSSYILNSLVNLILESPTVLLELAIVGFVFFFTLKDSKELINFVIDVSPLSKNHEKILITKFNEVTSSILYGQLIVGVVQGITAGIAIYLFGVPNALILSIAAIVLSIIPMTGAFFIWIPVTLYLLYSSSPAAAIGFLIYNILITSTIDNVLRSYIVARHSNISSAIIFVGMISGLFFFGLLGIILGPLLLVYLIELIADYRKNKPVPQPTINKQTL